MHPASLRPWLILLLLLSGQAVFPAVPVAARPNILYCLADDWSWPHAGAYGDRVVRVPNFDRLAREGALFSRAYSAAPSCTPSRAAMLTGRATHQLDEGALLHGLLSSRFVTYPDLLEKAGYRVGFTRKGWGPGNFQAGGRPRNPAGPQFNSFANFLKSTPTNQPFCFWFGSHDPHRPYEKNAGEKAGLLPSAVRVPSYWPDSPEVRGDILDYYARVERFDADLGEVLKLLADRGQADNTLVVVSGDNGWPFPRCKANLYEMGTHQPLAIRWPARFQGGKSIDAFVNLYDLAPTFLEAAGLTPAPDLTGQSLLGLLDGKTQTGRDSVFLERERHANVRAGDLGYPSRAIRTREYLYIRNLRPDRWPAGDPQMWKAVGPFGDCDAGPTKDFILAHQDEVASAKFFNWSFAKRPAEEFYDLAADPEELHNLAGEPRLAAAQEKLRAELDRWMRETKDPRAVLDDDHWDKFPYFGDPRPMPNSALNVLPQK